MEEGSLHQPGPPHIGEHVSPIHVSILLHTYELHIHIEEQTTQQLIMVDVRTRKSPTLHHLHSES